VPNAWTELGSGRRRPAPTRGWCPAHRPARAACRRTAGRHRGCLPLGGAGLPGSRAEESIHRADARFAENPRRGLGVERGTRAHPWSRPRSETCWPLHPRPRPGAGCGDWTTWPQPRLACPDEPGQLFIADRSDDEPRSRCAPPARPAGGRDLVTGPLRSCQTEASRHKAVSPTPSRYRARARQTEMNGRSHGLRPVAGTSSLDGGHPQRQHADGAFAVQLARFRPAWASPWHTQTVLEFGWRGATRGG
jgi:hypothetical protein